jgi:hypothetical protein
MWIQVPFRSLDLGRDLQTENYLIIKTIKNNHAKVKTSIFFYILKLMRGF